MIDAGHAHTVTAQAFDNMHADESGAAGDEYMIVFGKSGQGSSHDVKRL
jgi:hypothetical protein